MHRGTNEGQALEVHLLAAKTDIKQFYQMGFILI
jgi:hypothetical protein